MLRNANSVFTASACSYAEYCGFFPLSAAVNSPCHCVIGIRHGNDPCDLRYRVPFQTVGVALAIVPLVVVFGAVADALVLMDVPQN